MKVPLSAILLCHNEEETIKQEVINYYTTVIKKIPGSELIIAEDGSTDNTRNILHKLGKNIPLTLNVTPEKRGYAKSLRLALRKAKGSHVFYADAGGKHDPKDFWKLYKKINNYDLISGYKKKRNDPFHRIILARGLNYLTKFYFGIRFQDIDSGFKLLNRKAVNAVLKDEWILKNNISLEIVLRIFANGLRGIEVPVIHNPRKFGPSRGLPLNKIPKVVINLLKTFPKIKKQMLIIKKDAEKRNMITRYDEFFHTGKYRTLWEGKISVIYKLPKYIRIITKLIGYKKQQSMLEVGCGDGEIAEQLLSNKKLGIASYTATELSEGGVAYARKILSKFKKINVSKMDAMELQFKDKEFDTVFAIDVMHHVSNPKKMGSEMIRVAKSKVFLLESNGLSIPRRIAELQKRYKQMGEKSYYPWQYKYFLENPRAISFKIRPFLFMVPRIPEIFIPINIGLSELIEKIPLINWQCSGVIIEVLLKK